jgi:hypothetical protein
VRQAAQVFAAVVEPILVPMVGFEASARVDALAPSEGVEPLAVPGSRAPFALSIPLSRLTGAARWPTSGLPPL